MESCGKQWVHIKLRILSGWQYAMNKFITSEQTASPHCFQITLLLQNYGEYWFFLFVSVCTNVRLIKHIEKIYGRGGWSLFTKVDQTSGSKLDNHLKLYTKLRCPHVCFYRALLKTNYHFALCLNYKGKSLRGVYMKSRHVIRIAIEFPKINIFFVSNRKVHPKCRQDEHLLKLSIHKQNNLFCVHSLNQL